MLIDAIELFHVAMPLISPWRTAYGEDARIESVLVRMHSGGLSAWGESSPLAAPCYSPEWAAGVFACVRDWLAPAIVGRAIGSGDDLQAKLAHFKGNQFAKGALDTAWWVLEATRRGMPLYKLLGGKEAAVGVGADFGVMDSIDELLSGMQAAVDAGFPRIKLKFRAGWDVNMLRAARQSFPTETIHIDCNSGYTLQDFEMFCRLDDFMLAMIEQPLAHDDLVDHAELQQAVRTPICLDESINSVRRAEQAIDLGSCRYMNIKPGRVGGLTPAVKIHNLCRSAGIPCWVGGMLESAVGARICLALATLDNFRYAADIFPSNRFYTRDLGNAPLALDERENSPDRPPTISNLEVPGIGAEPDEELMAELTVNHARIEPAAGARTIA